MTFAETQTLIYDIQEIETWTRSYERESNKEKPDYNRLADLSKYLQEAKEKVFAHCTK